MKFDQVAFYTGGKSFEAKQEELNRIFDFKEDWIYDQVVAAGFVRGCAEQAVKNVARLAFNYDHGMEIEVIDYIDGPDFLFYGPPNGMVSHFGYHCESDRDFATQFARLSQEFQLAQHVITQSHTNEYLIQQKRTYEYAIFDTRTIHGTYTKIIRRIEG